jgi:hypothetical protein
MVSADDDSGAVAFDHSLTVGRHPDNDLCLDRVRVSSRHATLEWDGARWRLRDLGSKNGTSVNGKRVKATAPLKPGDLLRFGGASRWRVETLAPPTAAASLGATETAARPAGDLDLTLELRFDGPDSGTVRGIHRDREWTVPAGQPLVLLAALARDAGAWIDDDTLKVRIWGRIDATQVAPSSLHKLIHDTRQLLTRHGAEGWLVEKSRGRTRLALDPARVRILGP